MAEDDRVDISEEVNPPVPTHSQPPSAHAPPPPTLAGILPAYSGAPPTHLPPLTSSGAPLPPVFPGQRSPTADDEPTITRGAKDRQNECKDAQRSIGGRGALNSTPHVQTGQNRLSRCRVARTFVHAMHGDIRLIQILIIQAFQIHKLIGHRRSDARSIKSQAFSGFSLNRMGPTAQPSRAIKPRLNPKPRLAHNQPRLRLDSPKPSTPSPIPAAPSSHHHKI
ncbi:hypothetical protein CRG98_009134 [Punica granatum]|uniref:Uncharacterized protein n=1 Tax=Punica granatum TaxID=22663 RepID=A0A2I0KPQ3_PUNGR|nr:hypothetical protein CRG98_009134 [Punica granatum]